MNNNKLEVELAEEGTPMWAFQKERTDAISEMFDNKYENGIYPTSHFFARLDKCVQELIEKSKADGEAQGIRRCVEAVEKISTSFVATKDDEPIDKSAYGFKVDALDALQALLPPNE